MKFKLIAPHYALTRINGWTLSTRWSTETFVQQPARSASPGFDAIGKVTIEQSMIFPDPPQSWMQHGMNHRKVGLRTWERDVEIQEHAIDIHDLKRLIFFLIEWNAHLDVTADPPCIIIPRIESGREEEE